MKELDKAIWLVMGLIVPRRKALREVRMLYGSPSREQTKLVDQLQAALSHLCAARTTLENRYYQSREAENLPALEELLREKGL